VTTLTTDGTLHGVMAADAAYLYFRYWYNYVFNIARVGKNGGVKVDLAVNHGTSGIAVDSNFVYWTEQTTGLLKKVPTSGGSVTTLASGLSAPLRLAVDETRIYWIENSSGAGLGSIKEISKNGGVVTTLAAGLDYPKDIAVDLNNIYWSEAGTSTNNGAIKKIPKSALHIYSISGKIRSTINGLQGVTVTIGGVSTVPTPVPINTNTDGLFSFISLADDTYNISPGLPGYIFNPLDRTIVISGVSVTGQDFRACQVGAPMAGTLRDATTGKALSNIKITVDGTSTAITDGNGNYSITGLSCGAHTVTTSVLSGYAGYTRTFNSFDSWAWDINLTKTSNVYGGNTSSGYGGDPVNTAIGNYIYQSKDFDIPGKGMAFTFERNYNSQDTTDGPLGFGWNFNLNSSLTVDAVKNITIRWGDGKTETYAVNGFGSFTPQYGVFDTLIDNGNSTYSVRKRDRTNFNFNTANRLTSIVDKNGNAISLIYNGANLSQVTDTAGRVFTFTYDTNNHMTLITDSIGRTIQFTYDTNGDLISAAEMNGNMSVYTYDTNHQILTITDPLGNIVVSNTYDAVKRVVTFQKDARNGQSSYNYNNVDRITTVTDALGHIAVYKHDELLRLIKKTDANGNSTFYSYDAVGNRTKLTDMNGNTETYTYDAEGNVLKKVNALNFTTSIIYDADNNPLTRTDPIGNITTFIYDAKGNVLSKTDSLGHTTAYTYDANGLPLTKTDASGGVITNVYDAHGNKIRITDTLGNETQYTYDSVGRLLTKTDALGHVTAYSYDKNGNLLMLTDPAGKIIMHYDGNNSRLNTTDKNGNVTRFTYDQKNLLLTTTDALSRAITNAYDALGRKISVTDKNRNTIHYGYDRVGNLIQVTDALGNIRQFSYDANGNRLSATNSLGNTKVYAYDALNRKISETDALGNTTKTTYNALGRVISTTNAKGQITSFVYDAAEQLVQITDAIGGKVSYTYDNNGNRLSIIDAKGSISSFAYDALNRLISKTEALGGNTSFKYDVVGNITQRSDANGILIQQGYNQLDWLNLIIYPDGSTVSFTYDANGNRTQMVDATGITTYIYDKLSQLTVVTDSFGKTVAYGYDANGNLTSITYPGGQVVNYAFDAVNHLVSVTDWLSRITLYNYDTVGRLKNVINPNGTTVTYVYDTASRLTKLTNAKSDSTVLSSYTYTLDKLGNQSQVVQTEPLPPLFATETLNYTYDAENRLIVAEGMANTFDANGNMTVKDADIFAYDFEDRLMQSFVNGVTTQYQYDGLGNRLARTEGATTQRYILDTNSRLSRVLAETDSAGNETALYVYGLGLISKVLPNGTAYNYHYNSRGSTIAVTDSIQVQVAQYAYYPFGKLANSTGTFSNPFKYAGRYGVMDEGNGISYIRARYYHAGLGRFLSKDAKAVNDQDGQSLNLNRYIYALDDPVNLIDISGFSPQEGGVASTILGSSDTLHEAFVDHDTLLSRMGLLDEIAVLQGKTAYWNARADILQGVYDALQTTQSLLTGNVMGVGTGLAHQVSTLLLITGHGDVAKSIEISADIVQLVDSTHSFFKNSHSLNKLMDQKYWAIFSKASAKPLISWGLSVQGLWKSASSIGSRP